MPGAERTATGVTLQPFPPLMQRADVEYGVIWDFKFREQRRVFSPATNKPGC